MHVDLMRFVDKWAGVPLCAMLSAVNAARAPLRRGRASAGTINDPKKILFLQLSEMGSAIMAYRALTKARSLFPGAQLYYCIFEEMQESIRLLDIIPPRNIFTIPSRSAAGFVFGTAQALRGIRQQGIDMVIDMELFARFSSIISYVSGAPIRVGFHKFHMEGLYRGSLQTHNVLYNHLQHISLNFLALVCAAHEAQDETPHTKIPAPSHRPAPPKISPSPGAQSRIRRKLKAASPGFDETNTLVLLNPNGSNLLPLRRWPIKNYTRLAQKLLASHPSVYVAVTGTAAEKKDAAAICDALDDERCINFAGQTTLRELIDLYTVAHMLVSNDSGPPNFASMTSIPTLVLFGPETPQCYRPLGDNIDVCYAGLLCSPCVSAYNHRKSPCRDNKCMQAIGVDDVYRRVVSTLRLPE